MSDVARPSSDQTLERFADLLEEDPRDDVQQANDAILGVGVLLGAECPHAAATYAKLVQAAYPDQGPWPWTYPKPPVADET